MELRNCTIITLHICSGFAVYSLVEAFAELHFKTNKRMPFILLLLTINDNSGILSRLLSNYCKRVMKRWMAFHVYPPCSGTWQSFCHSIYLFYRFLIRLIFRAPYPLVRRLENSSCRGHCNLMCLRDYLYWRPICNCTYCCRVSHYI